MIGALGFRADLLGEREPGDLGDVARVDEVRSSPARGARPGAGRDLRSCELQNVREGRGPEDGRGHRLASQMRFDLHVPGHRIEPRRGAKSGEFHDMTNPGSDRGVDQGNLVLDLLKRSAVRNVDPVGALEGVRLSFRSKSTEATATPAGRRASSGRRVSATTSTWSAVRRSIRVAPTRPVAPATAMRGRRDGD